MVINLNLTGKSYFTTALGIISAACMVLKTQGVAIGHIGKGDWLDLIMALAVAGIGLAAKDWNVASTQAQVNKSTAQQAALPNGSKK
jgi:hypothetical protein